MTKRAKYSFVLAALHLIPVSPRVPSVAAAAIADAAPAALRSASAASVQLSTDRLSEIDGVVSRAILRHDVPGAVVLIGRHGSVVFRRAYGFRALQPHAEPMTVDTLFDLASLTKVVATAPSVMLLVERGMLRLDDRISKWIPEFGTAGGGRESITLEQLLLHTAGFPPDDPIDLYTGTPAEIFARKFAQPLARPPGTAFVYSDVGYEILGEVIRRVSGLPLDEFARKNLFEPLGMRETAFRPIGKDSPLPSFRIAPTEKREGVFLRGAVHDPRSHALGGVAGHAGLFSSADDLARFCSAILAGGRTGKFTKSLLSPAALAAMTRPRAAGPSDLRGLGWDIATSYSGARGDLLPIGSFGHTGWTGTSIWLDPLTDMFVVILSNRNHPDGAGDARALRSQVATVAASAVLDISPEEFRAASARVQPLLGKSRDAASNVAANAPAPGEVQSGIDVLCAEEYRRIAGKRIALLTNSTGRLRDTTRTIDALRSPAARAAGVRLVRLFSPEHGVEGIRDEKIADSIDEVTGLPVRSLYGANRRPVTSDFAGLDAVLVDLQDAGTRFYTYLTTTGYLLEEAAKAHVAVVVLDRPDPIGADKFEGPLALPEELSFTAYHTLPIRTGLTIGEAARLFQKERVPDVDLTVIPMSGYRRELWYDETGLPWTSPSPNLRSVIQAALYPGIALLEPTNVSVGRGTDSPFEQFGAPWMDGVALAGRLSRLALPGVRFLAVKFKPAASTHAGAECQGVRITVVDRRVLEPVRLGLEIAFAIRALHPREWDRTRFGSLLANARVREAFERGESVARLEESWGEGLRAFEKRRASIVLY